MLSACAAEPERHRTFCAVSLNLAKEPSSHKVVKAICAEPDLRDADLFLFQEVRRDSGKASVADEVAGRLGFSACFSESPDATDQGLAIELLVLPRYPSAFPGWGHSMHGTLGSET